MSDFTWFASDDQRVSADRFFVAVAFVTTRAHAAAALAEMREHFSSVTQVDGPRALTPPRVIGGVTYGFTASVRGRPDRDWPARDLEGQLRYTLRTPRVELAIAQVALWASGPDGVAETFYDRASPVRQTAERAGGVLRNVGGAALDAAEGAGELAASTASGLNATGSIFQFLGPVGGLILVGALAFVGYKVLTRKGLL